ncbi:MAG: gliding motility protein GldC [Bacteroidia bacterium]
MENEIVRTSQIRIDVHLDQDKMPSRIQWEADDSDAEGKHESKSVMLAFWDGLVQNAMRIDLWTKDMTISEMNLFMYQTLVTFADTFENATDNKEVAAEMRDFAHQIGHKLEVFGTDHHH